MLDAGTGILEDAAHDEIGRLNRMAEAWRRYYGDYPDTFRRHAAKANDNIKVNYARFIVDKGVSFLFGRGLRWELVEGATTDEEVWLEQIWRVNRRDLLLHRIAIYGAICGHVFIKIHLDSQLRLVAVNPQHVSVVWDANDMERVVEYRIQYPSVDRGQAVEYRQVIRRESESVWLIQDHIRSAGAKAWMRIGEEEWRYPFPPIVDCQNLPDPSAYYGISDIEPDVIELNNAINFVLSNTKRILRYHAHPRTYATGISARELDMDVDRTLIFQNPQAALKSLEMQGDLESSIEFYKRLKEALHEVSRTPEIATGKLDNVGSLSGLALQILYSTLIEKTNTKRLFYGDMLIELNRRLLAIGGYGDDRIVTLHWPELLPTNSTEERQVALMDLQIGVSRDTLMRKLGYEPDMESQKREVEGAEMADQLLGAFDRGE